MVPVDPREIAALNVAADAHERMFEEVFPGWKEGSKLGVTFIDLMQAIRRFVRIAETTTHVAGIVAAFEPKPAQRRPQDEGFEGIACGKCGMFKMRRAGTCLTCHACGENTGCG